MSSLVAQFIEVALPSMERLVVVLERAATAPKEARDGLIAAVERAERTLLPALVSAQDQNDLFLIAAERSMQPSVPAVPAVHAQRARRAAAAPAGAPDPRLVTRGSGFPGRVPKAVKKGVRRG